MKVQNLDLVFTSYFRFRTKFLPIVDFLLGSLWRSLRLFCLYWSHQQILADRSEKTCLPTKSVKIIILATGGAPDCTNLAIFKLWHFFWLHRSPKTWFCVKSIKYYILHLQLRGFVKRMLENSQNLFQSFKTFVFHPLRVQNTKKQPVQTTGIVEVEIVTWESSTKEMHWKWNFETGFDYCR